MNNNTFNNRLADELAKLQIHRDRATDFVRIAWIDLVTRGIIPGDYDWTFERQELFGEILMAQIDAGWRFTDPSRGTIQADIVELIHSTWWRMQNQLRRAEAEPASLVTVTANNSPMPRPGVAGATWDDLFDWLYARLPEGAVLDLKDVANMTDFAHGTVKNNHARYKPGITRK